MTILLLGDIGFSRSINLNPAGSAIGSRQLVSEVDRFESVVSSFTKLILHLSVPAKLVLVIAAWVLVWLLHFLRLRLTSRILLSCVLLRLGVLLLLLRLSNCDCCCVFWGRAHYRGFWFYACFRALYFPVCNAATGFSYYSHYLYTSSFLFVCSSALSTPASAVVPSVAFRCLCNHQARRDSEYADLEDCFVVKAVDVERLTAEVQSFTEQVTVFCVQNAQQQKLLDLHASRITSLQRVLSHARH